MSILRRHRADEKRSLPSGAGLLSLEQYVSLTGHGSSLTRTSVQSIETALSSSVVWRCAMKNAATLASFPVHTYRGLERIPDPAIVADPAGDASLRSSWVFASVLSMYLRGGANYWLSGPEESSRITRAQVLHPDRVTYDDRNGWKVDTKSVDLWPIGNLYHVPLYVMPGSPKGLNPLQFAARSLFPGLAAQEFGGNFFRDGSHPTAIIAPETDPGPDGARELKDRVMAAVSGTNREPIVIPQSVKWTQIQINPDDSQFIETMGLSDEQVCRYMGTPPEEVGIAPSGGKALTYANREQRKQDYLQELLYPKGQLEGAWSALLARPQQVKLNPDGLLRADLKGRYESYKLAAEIESLTGSPVLTTDEMRALEDRLPLPDDNDEGDAAQQRQLSVAEVVQKVYLGVGKVVTSDEAREIVNAAGGNLTVPGPPMTGDAADV